jgi:Flp pilus assembly pilin Flp
MKTPLLVKAIAATSRMPIPNQRGSIATEYVLLLVFVAAVLFVPYNGTDLVDLILQAIRKMNANYIKGLSYGATPF